MKEKNLLTTHYLAAFVTANLDRVSYDKKQHEQYKALTLLVVTHLSFQGGHDSKIKQLCNELRQYALGNRERLAAYLPDICPLDMPELIDALEGLEQQEEVAQTNIKNQLSNIRVPFRDAYLNKEGYTRDVKSREFQKDGRLQVTNKKYLDDEQSASAAEIKELSFGDKQRGSATWFEEEEQSATSKTLSMVSSSEFVKRDYATQALQARAINEKIRKRSMVLSCDVYSMTPFELRHLVSTCTSTLRAAKECQEHARVLLLMLLTGNTLEEVRSWHAQRNDNRNIIGIKRKFKLPSQKLRKELRPLVREVSDVYTLPLPLNLVSELKDFKFSGLTEGDLRAFLSTLNKQDKIHLTLKKVSSYLNQVLRAHDTDSTVIDLITGYDAKNQPARYYTYIPEEKLQTVFNRYMSHIGSAGKTDYLKDLEYSASGNGLGSPLFVDPMILQSLFAHLQTAISEGSVSKEVRFSEQTHNLRVLYLQLVLALVSGYRPVNGWFGTIDDIHFATGEYRIAEKEREMSYNGRVVFLPPVALGLIQDYLAYCEQSAIYFAHKDPVISQRYRQAIKGDMPFCFYRYQENTQEISPSAYMQHIDPIFPLPANWARHYLRSYLFSQNVSDERIGAWMGHIHSGQLPFAQFSQLRRKDLQYICDTLEAHVMQLLNGAVNEQ